MKFILYLSFFFQIKISRPNQSRVQNIFFFFMAPKKSKNILYHSLFLNFVLFSKRETLFVSYLRHILLELFSVLFMSTQFRECYCEIFQPFQFDRRFSGFLRLAHTFRQFLIINMLYCYCNSIHKCISLMHE